MNMRHHDEQNQLLRQTIIIELAKNPNLGAADDTLKSNISGTWKSPRSEL
jgi:hypothetical protein